MAVIRENTFDGPDETAVTTANSANHGDGFDTVDSPGVTYDTDEFHQGTASVRLDNTPGSNGGAWQSLSLGDCAFRVYVNRGTATSGNFVWNDDFGGFSIGSGGDIDWAGTTLNGVLPENDWARVEFTRSGTSGTLSVWSTDPQSTGAPDATTTDTISDATITQWWFEHDAATGAIWVDAYAIGDDDTEIGPFAEPDELEGTATTSIALASSADAGGFETSVVLTGGVPDGRLCVVYGTANNFDSIVSLPAHWIQLRTDPIGGGRRTWVWWFIADGEPANYTVEFNGEHFHFLHLSSWHNAVEIRAHDGSVDDDTDSLALPVLAAQPQEVLLALGFNWLETAKSWSPAGLTEIVNLPRAIISGYEVTEAGPTTAYTLNTADSGAMNTTALLLHGPGGVHFGGSVTVGSRDAESSAAGTAEILGAVEGGADHSASVSGTVVFSGAAQGFSGFSGEAHGSFDIGAPAAEGDAERFGEAHGTFTLTGAAEVDSEGTGQAHGDIVLSGAAEPESTRQGEAHGTLSFGGTAVGTSFRLTPDVPILGLRVRLVAYDPDGDRLGELPQPLSYQVGVPLNDMPSLALEYSRAAQNSALLDSPCEVAVEVAALDSLSYFEPPGCRFLNLRAQDDTVDRTEVVRYTMPHYGWMLSKVCNINEAAFDDEGKRVFSQATPGEIVRAFIIEAQARGNVPGLAIDFSAAADSSGQPWPMDTVMSISFDAGQPLLAVVQALAEQGMFDWRFTGRTLQLYSADTFLNRDRRTQVVLNRQRDVEEAPNDATYEELASTIFIMGDEGAYRTEDNPSALTPWGEWEEAINQGGISDQGTMAALAQVRLAQTQDVRVQMSRRIAFPTTRYLPFVHYRPGDRITAPGRDGSNEELRVRQITLESREPHSTGGILILNDRFVERDLRRIRQVAAIVGGSGGGTGGSGSSPGEDTRRPAAPEGFLLSTDTFINEMGEARGQITASWLEVTTASDGTEMAVSGYQVWMREVQVGVQFRLRTEVDSPDTAAFMSPFEIDQLYQVRVRAIGRNGQLGLYTETQAISPDSDLIPPDPPSTPALSTRLGVIRVAWDGLTDIATDMPRDFDHVRVWMSDNPGSGFEHIDTLYRAGVAIVPDQPYDEERWFYFTALDRSENESEPSAQASTSTAQLVGTDVSPGSIGYELLEEGAVRDDILADDAVTERSIAAGAVTAEKIRAYSITADRIAVGNTRNLLADPNFTDSDLNDVRTGLSNPTFTIEPEGNGKNWAQISRADVADGTYTFFYVQSVEAESLSELPASIITDEDLGRVIARFNVTVGNLTSGSANITGLARFLDQDGQVVSTVGVIPALTINGDVTDLEYISTNGGAIPAGAFGYILVMRVILTGTPADAFVRFNRAFTATTNGQVLIEDGAVTANKIQANAITADKIDAGAVTAVHIQADAIQTSQLDADAITAKHTVTGALIQTTATSNRGIRLTSGSLTAWDQNGNNTFFMSAITGNVITTGTYQSGLSGENRVLISSTATWATNPGIRLLSGDAGARDSALFLTVPGDGSGFPDYSVVMAGSEVVRNSSGRTDLVLEHGSGGGGRLIQQFGTYSQIGIEFEQWDMLLRGRITSGTGARDYIVWHRTSTIGGTSGNIQVTYGQSGQNGGRLVIACGYASNTTGRHMDVTVAAQNLSNCFINYRDVSNNPVRINLIALWVDQNVGGT